MAKKKLFAWCDFLVPTGFGNVAKNLLDDMHKDYDVTVLGINHHGEKRYDTEKYFVYPVSRDDMLGFKKLIRLLRAEQPDIVFLFQDIFHISECIEKVKEAAPHAKIVSYFPIDGAPVSFSWGNVFDHSDALIAYSDWAIDEIRHMKNYNVPDKKIWKLYHGVDKKTFYPLPKDEIENLRAQFGWTDKFVVSNINRFQPRKFIPGTARAFSMFAKGWKENPENGWRMPLDRDWCELSRSKNLKAYPDSKLDVFLYLHCMPKEMSMGPGKANLLQNHLLNAGFVDADVNSILGVNARNIYAGEVPDEMINQIYNASNVNISTTLGEGCGLSLIEAASTGTASIAPYNSAVPEMLRDTGHLIPNNAVINQALDNGHLRPVVDTAAMTDALQVEYDKWKKEAKGGKVIDTKCISNVEEHFRWEDKRELLKEIFVRSLNGTVNES